MFKGLVVGLALILCGCATGAADQTLSFDSNSKKSIVVFGWEGLDRWWGKTVLISFRGFDQNYQLDKRAFSASNGNGWQEMKPIEYFVLEVEPGGYIVNSTMTHIGMPGGNFIHFVLAQ